MRNFLAGLLACAVMLCAGYGLASRNSVGTMSAANGPYISGTSISSSAINSRFADIETEITDSLSRSGKGGMSAALRGTDGTVAAPAFSFTSEPGSGIYRIGANDYGFSVNGSKKHEWTSTGETVTGQLCVNGSCDSTVQSEVLNAGSQWSGSNFGQNLILKGSRNNAIGIFDSAGANPWAITNGAGALSFATMPALSDAATTATVRLSVSAAGAMSLPGSLTIGANGTAIGASIRGTQSFTPGSIPANFCTSIGSVTVTGAAVGSECMLGLPGGPGSFAYSCGISGTGSCTITICNPTVGALTAPAGTYACRVFNP